MPQWFTFEFFQIVTLRLDTDDYDVIDTENSTKG